MVHPLVKAAVAKHLQTWAYWLSIKVIFLYFFLWSVLRNISLKFSMYLDLSFFLQ